MNWLRWNWLDQGLLPLLLAGLRCCWILPWLGLAATFLAPSHAGRLLAPALIIGLPLLAFTLTQLAPLRTLAADRPNAMPRTETPWWARIGIAVTGLVVIGLVIWWQEYRFDYPVWDGGWLQALGYALIRWPSNELPAPLLMLLALIYLWLRGMLDAAQPMSHDDIWGAIIAGVLALVLYLGLITTLGLPAEANLGGLVVLFFAAGMAALAFSSLKITVGLDYALGLGQRRPKGAPRTTRYWLLSVLVVVGGLIGLGVGLALVVAPEQVARLIDAVGFVLGLIWRVVGFVLVVISYVLFALSYWLVQALMPLIQRLLAMLAALELIQPQEQPEATPMPETPAFDPATIPDPYRWLALALSLLAVLLIFALVLRKLRNTPVEEIDEERESILSAELLKDQLASLWRRWFGGLAERLSPFLSLDGEAETRRIIRLSYQGLLAAATGFGQARLRGQTPTEFRLQLAEKLRDSVEPLTAMTERYNQARYAPDPPSVEDATATQQAWADVQRTMNDDPPATPLLE